MALKYLRDNLKSLTWILWLVVVVFIMLIFFEWGGFNDRAMGGSGQQYAAKVGDKIVTIDEFRQAHQNLENVYRQTLGENYNRELLKQFNLPKQALDQLIEQKILLIEAERIGLGATDAEVQKTVLSYPVFKDEDGHFVGAEKYRSFLRSNRLSVDEFEQSVRESVLLSKLNDVLLGTTYVSDEELEKAYREQAEKAKIRFVQVPASQFADQEAGTEEVATYFAKHQEDYALPEQRVADYLMVDTARLRREVEIPEEELRAYYDSHSEEFTREEQVRARHILIKVTPSRPEAQAESALLAARRRIEAGEDFSQLAGELSEDEGSATRGGSLGYFGRGQMVKPFEDAAFGAPVGTIVGPVKSDFGFHLIEVQDKREGGLQPFEQAKAVARARLLGDRTNSLSEEKIQDVAQIIAERSLSTAEELSALAEEEGLTWSTTEPFGENDNVTGIGRAPGFTSAAFTLGEGALSEPLSVPRGWVILRLAEIKAPRIPELSEVESRVKLAANLEARKTAAATRLKELRDQLEGGGDFDQLVNELGVEPQESAEFGRFGTISGLGSNNEVVDGALALQVGEWGGPALTNQGAVLYEVIERKSYDAAEFEEEKGQLREREENQRLNQLRSSLIELRHRDLVPGYGPQVVENFNLAPSTSG
jgi:peptidyl-prolyl cis-trans isomerase D